MTSQRPKSTGNQSNSLPDGGDLADPLSAASGSADFSEQSERR